jgi:hypothetical protein
LIHFDETVVGPTTTTLYTAGTERRQTPAALLVEPDAVDIRRVGTQIKANARRGVSPRSCYVMWPLAAMMTRTRAGVWSRAPDSARPRVLKRNKSREKRMTEAGKKAASRVLAQLLAVTAMLVIASLVFYTR